MSCIRPKIAPGLLVFVQMTTVVTPCAGTRRYPTRPRTPARPCGYGHPRIQEPRRDPRRRSPRGRIPRCRPPPRFGRPRPRIGLLTCAARPVHHRAVAHGEVVGRPRANQLMKLSAWRLQSQGSRRRTWRARGPLRPPSRFQLGAATRQDVQDIPDGLFPIGKLWQGQMALNLIAVATTFPKFDDVTGVGQVGDDRVGVPLSDAEFGRDLAKANLGVLGDAEERPSVVGEKAPMSHSEKIPLCRS